MGGYDKSPDYSPQGGFWTLLFWLCIMAAISVAWTWAALADEQLCPKYGQCVPASAFDCQAIDRSSVVTRVCYSAAERYMIVRLKQTDYHYCSIPPSVVSAFLAADSMGRFYNAEIKSDATGRRYDCRDHPVPTF